METCPCGSAKPYSQCCEPLIRGERALTPEALMRARYSAYVNTEVDFIEGGLITHAVELGTTGLAKISL